VPEGIQVQVQVAAISSRGQDAHQLGGITRRKTGVSRLAGKVDDRLWPQAAVKVVVEQDLRSEAELVNGEHVPHCYPSTLTSTNGGGCGGLVCEITIALLSAALAASNFPASSARSSRITWPPRT
jgi:hypothetical protein